MNKGGFSDDGCRVLTCDALTETGLVRHGFSKRCGGESTGIFRSLNLGRYTEDDPKAVYANFSLFSRDIGVQMSHIVLPRQIHSTRVYPVTRKDAGKGLVTESDLPDADALVTNEPGVCLAAFYADCTPILLLDPVRHVIASVHSGWRGTLGQIVKEAVLCMEEKYGSFSKDILAAMGPSIKQCHFEVDEDVYLRFAERFQAVAEQNTVRKNRKYYIDTDALNVHSLKQAGLLPEHIFLCPECTYCQEERFFSHRREGRTGRMCAMIELV